MFFIVVNSSLFQITEKLGLFLRVATATHCGQDAELSLRFYSKRNKKLFSSHSQKSEIFFVSRYNVEMFTLYRHRKNFYLKIIDEKQTRSFQISRALYESLNAYQMRMNTLELFIK